MELSKPFHRKKIVVIFLACILIFSGLSARVVYLMVFRAAHYSELALDLHQRERKIKAKRGRILDRNGIVLADNQPVCTISVIHNQIRDPDAVIALLCSKLGLSEETVRKRVEKVSSIEKIKSNVDLETGEEIYRTGLDGIKVDEDYKRYYPYEDLASKVIGFTGGDNQGILALESRYEEVLSGQEGLILEMTDARGVRLLDEGESRVEPVDGKDLYISLDANIQLYAQQLGDNLTMLADIRAAIAGGMPTIAECGGFLLLHKTLTGVPMADICGGTAQMGSRLKQFGYITLTANSDSLLCRQGETLTAHEFHYAQSTQPGADFSAQKPLRTRGWQCIHASDTLHAGYPHIHFAGNVPAAQRFLHRCQTYHQEAKR